MKVKRTELVKLKDGIVACGNLTGEKFVYATIKNKRLIEQELKDCKDMLKDKKEYTEFNNKRGELCEKYCTKDKNNKPIIVNGKYTGLEVNSLFTKELKTLQKKYKEAIDTKQNQIIDYNKAMVGEAEIKLHMVKKSEAPMNTITGKQYDGVFIMIDDK